jgi:cytochrome c oxidase subunit II
MFSTRQLPMKIILLAAGVLGPLALVGCAGSPSALSPASQNAAMVTNLFFLLFTVAVVVFIIVESLLFFSVIHFRRKNSDEMPTQIHGNTRLEIIWTAIPAVILAVVFILTWQTLSALAAVPANSLNIKVTGHQWWWQVEYPDLGVVTANEIHLPVGQAAVFSLESKDVIHSFWVPELSGKTDLIPGKTNRLWFRPDKVGTYRGQCAEFCGTSHANMRFSVVVESADQFNTWVAQQKTPSLAPTTDLAKQGLQQFTTTGCQACHTIDGTTALGQAGPNLTHVASRATIAAGMLTYSGQNMHLWIADPQAIKPGAIMPKLPLTKEQLDALVAYIETLK